MASPLPRRAALASLLASLLSAPLATPLAAQTVRTLPLAAPLGTPDGIAVGPDGTLYVADYDGGAGTRVLRVDRDGRVTTFADGFKAPDGLAFDAAGRLYVSSFAGGTIHRVTPDGAVSLFASGLDHPSALAFDAAGTLYVSNFGNFDGTTVSRVAPDGTVTPFARGFRVPLGLAFGPDGLLYVGSYASGEIHRVSPDGRVERFASVGAAPLPQLQYLAFDRHGTLYAASLGHDRVYAVTPDGRVRPFAGSGVAGHADGAGAAARFHGPNSVAVRGGDTVLVTEYQSGRVRAIAPAAAAAPARDARRPNDAVPGRAAEADGRRLAGDSAAYVVTQVGRDGRRDSLGVLVAVTRRRGDTLTLVQHYDTRPLRSRDTVHLDARAMRPLARRAGPAERRAETSYAAGRVRVLRPAAAGVDTLDVADVPAGTFEGATLDAVAAALPLGDGWSGALPLFVAAQRGVVWGEARARRAEGAPEPAWDVRIAYPSALVTVRVAERGRRVLGVEYDYGARRLVFARTGP